MACRAQLNGVDAPTPEETDKHMEGIQAFAKQALAGASAAMLFTSSMEAAVAYPIFAQQNYANPREYTGKIVCANCHLASKPIEVRLPQAVLPDTIFKMEVEVPAKYAKRRQPLADGSKGPMNIGAIAVMPEGWKLAPKDRLPKPLKKEMKGLAWAPYSKDWEVNKQPILKDEQCMKDILHVGSLDCTTTHSHKLFCQLVVCQKSPVTRQQLQKI